MPQQAPETHALYWNDQQVGDVSNIQMDMGYIEGEWQPAGTAAAFEEAIAHLVGRAFWELSREQMVWVQIPDLNMNAVVVLAPVEGRNTFRLITSVEPPAE